MRQDATFLDGRFHGRRRPDGARIDDEALWTSLFRVRLRRHRCDLGEEVVERLARHAWSNGRSLSPTEVADLVVGALAPDRAERAG